MHKQINIVGVSLILTFFFKIAAYKSSLYIGLADSYFWMWYAYTFVVIFSLINLCRFLFAKTNLNSTKIITFIFLVLVIWQLIEIVIFNHEFKRIKNIYTLVLPFGLVLIILVTLYYKHTRIIKEQKSTNSKLKKDNRTFLTSIPTLKGQAQIDLSSIEFIKKTELYNEVHCNNEIFKVDIHST